MGKEGPGKERAQAQISTLVDADLRKLLDFALVERDLKLKDAISEAVQLWLSIKSTTGSNTVHDTVLTYTKPVDPDPPNPVADAPPDKDRVPTSQSELGVEIWVQMLRYILDHGDADTQAAITKNLERFHLLARLLNREVAIEPSSTPIPKPDSDQQKRMDRMREFGAKYPGSGSDSGDHESGVRPEMPPDTGRIGKRRKH